MHRRSCFGLGGPSSFKESMAFPEVQIGKGQASAQARPCGLILDDSNRFGGLTAISNLAAETLKTGVGVKAMTRAGASLKHTGPRAGNAKLAGAASVPRGRFGVVARQTVSDLGGR